MGKWEKTALNGLKKHLNKVLQVFRSVSTGLQTNVDRSSTRKEGMQTGKRLISTVNDVNYGYSDKLEQLVVAY